jgi:hypothetical protein
MVICLLIQCCCRCVDDLHGLAVGHPVLMTCCRLHWRTLGLVMLNPVFPGDCNMTKVVKLQQWIKYTAYYYCWSATVSAIASANNLKLMWEELNNIAPTSTPHKNSDDLSKLLSSHTCRESCKSGDLQTPALMSPWGTTQITKTSASC